MKKKIIIFPFGIAPITDDKVLNPLPDVTAIIFRNAGTATVSLFNGLYTLDPKETVSFNSADQKPTIELENIQISFDTGTGSVKKLEIVTLRKKHC